MSPIVLPMAAEHIASFRNALDQVAREKRFLAMLEAPPLEQVASFVGDNIRRDIAQFVALAGDQVVGWADIVPAWAQGVAHRGSLGMGVLPTFRGKGLGRRLLQACIAKSWANGLRRIELEVRADNGQAIRLYEGLGFRREGRKRRGLCIEGEAHDTLVMALLRDEGLPGAADGVLPSDAVCTERPQLVEQIVRALVLYSLAEVQQGHARTLRVSVGGNDFSVEDDGRGHAIHRSVENAPYLPLIYQHLGHRFDAGEPTPVQLKGLGMSLINAICEELTVIVREPAAELRMVFRGARLIDHEPRDRVGADTGNRISGRVGADLEQRAVDFDALEAWLCSVAQAHPALTLQLNGKSLRASSQADHGQACASPSHPEAQ